MGMLRRRHQERHELAAKGIEVQEDAIDATNTAETEPLEGVNDDREVDEDVIPVADTTKDGDEKPAAKRATTRKAPAKGKGA